MNSTTHKRLWNIILLLVLLTTCVNSVSAESSVHNLADKARMSDISIANNTGIENYSTGTPVSYTFLPIIIKTEDTIPVNSLSLIPFDVNQRDLLGPASWFANYGKIPEIIVASNGTELDVLLQDYNDETEWNAVLLHIEKQSLGYGVTQALTNIPFLDRVMGLVIDENGNRYYATGVDESDLISPEYPSSGTYRSDIVRVIKVNREGEILFNIDLDFARHVFDPSAEMVINPMTFGTSRLAISGNEIGILFSINTDSVDGIRHQKALSTRLEESSGAITRVSSVWVSHSFDQRLFSDNEEIIEYHLGDAYPRYLVFDRGHQPYPVFHIKGELGENLTATRLGNIASIENDPTYKFIALFASETSALTGYIYSEMINGPRNLAIVRLKDSDNSIDPNLPDELTVTSNGVEQVNKLRWVTNYTIESHLHAERPKIIGIGNNQYVVMWEEWLCASSYAPQEFNGVYAMLIDDNGNILRPKTLVTEEHHLPRGDDSFLLDNRAAWMTGDNQGLYIHFVDAFLNYEMMALN